MGVEAAVYYCSTEQLSKILYNSWEVFGAESSFSEQKQPRVFYKKAVLKNFILKACNFINKRLQHMCFPVNIVKLLMAPILKNIYERLLLSEVAVLQPNKRITA